MGKVFNYKDLNVWKKAHVLALKCFDITDAFPRKYLFDLTSQIRRASLSVPTNIVEGSASLHTKEYIQFLNISKRSVSEVRYLLEFAFERSLTNEEKHKEMKAGYQEVEKMLAALMVSLKKRISEQSGKSG